MRAITVKQPWAYAIFHSGKDVENRSQNICAEFPIDLAIHVSRTPDVDARMPRGYASLKRLSEAVTPSDRGKIIGVVTLLAIEESHASAWYQGGKYAYVLGNPRLLKTPLECRGYQSHWAVPMEIRRRFRYL